MPRKPPVLRRMALTLPSGSALTLCTVPSLLPSEEKTASPINGLALAGAVTDLSVRGVMAGSLGLVAGLVCGMGAGSGLAAGGGAVGDGGGVCWAVAGNSAAPLMAAAAASRRTDLRIGMCRAPLVVAVVDNGGGTTWFRLGSNGAEVRRLH